MRHRQIVEIFGIVAKGQRPNPRLVEWRNVFDEKRGKIDRSRWRGASPGNDLGKTWVNRRAKENRIIHKAKTGKGPAKGGARRDTLEDFDGAVPAAIRTWCRR